MPDVRTGFPFLESNPDPAPHFQMKVGSLIRPDEEGGSYTVLFDADGRTYRFRFGDPEDFVEAVKREVLFRFPGGLSTRALRTSHLPGVRRPDRVSTGLLARVGMPWKSRAHRMA